jgi:hypothetical protein
MALQDGGELCLRSEKNVVVVSLEVETLLESGDASVADVGALWYQIIVSAPCSRKCKSIIRTSIKVNK